MVATHPLRMQMQNTTHTNMKISLIVAMSSDRVIGRDQKMPWHLPDDLKHFREITLGNPILMGRKTHESIGRALPGRENIILTRDKTYAAKDCRVVHSIEEAIEKLDGQEGMIIGGATLYEAFLPIATRLYLTLVAGHFDGDTHFPVFNREDWDTIEQSPVLLDTATGIQFHYETLNRKTSKKQ